MGAQLTFKRLPVPITCLYADADVQGSRTIAQTVDLFVCPFASYIDSFLSTAQNDRNKVLLFVDLIDLSVVIFFFYGNYSRFSKRTLDIDFALAV